MFPDKPQPQFPVPASLPAVPVQAQEPSGRPQSAAALQAPANQGHAAANTTEQVVVQVKQLAGQYAQNPYQLSVAVQQLKAKYLAEQYNVTANPVEN